MTATAGYGDSATGWESPLPIDPGFIEPGKDATFLAATGDIRSQVKHLWIGGSEQSLESRHTRLSDRYRSRPNAK